ncbi:hypothetical protein RUM44_002706 [Polyplax serrata]|uniref:Tetratricopeptide repeat protein 36 n=1 Tax=Polyplax serrata TaxID=468196 RepID=A0ABR1AFJ5_POLSC
MSTARDKAILNSILNPFLPVDFEREEESVVRNDDPGDLTEEVLKAKQLEKEAISMADKGRVKDAVATFGNAIHLAPHLPSLYNNRAQAHRLLGDTHSALDDLNMAITLSKGEGRSACQAFCQRGLIRRKNGEEEKAQDDFKMAARLGSPFAKMVLVQSNPYAALCNDMLSQVLQKLAKGE